MKVAKQKIQNDRTIEQKFQQLQAKPAHVKMQQVKRIMSENSQLASVNTSLYACLQSLYNYAYKGKLNKPQALSSLLKDKKISNVGIPSRKQLQLIITQITKSMESDSEPVPTFLKVNKVEVGQPQNNQIKNKLNKSSFTQSSKGSFDSSTDPKSQSFGSYNSEDESDSYNNLIKQANQQNLDLKKQLQNIKHSNSVFKMRMQTLTKKFSLISSYISKKKVEVDSIKSEAKDIRQDFSKKLSNYIEDKREQFDNRLAQAVRQLKRQKELKIYDLIARMEYESGYECVPYSQVIGTNQQLSLENIRNKVIQDITLNRVKVLNQTLSLLRAMEFNEDYWAKVSSLPQQKIRKEIADQICAIVERKVKMKVMIDEMKSQQKKQEQKQSAKKLLQANPALYFLTSDILPVISKEEETELIGKNQQFVIGSVERHYKKSRKVCGLKYLYGYRRMVHLNSNFHLMVDSHPHLLLIIKLRNEVVMGAYSQQGICQENTTVSSRNKGFIFQCRNEIIYEVRSKYQNKSVMPYDPYYILVGNHDVKIRAESDTIESCFGYQTSMFRPTSEYTCDDILFCGKANNSTEIMDYQFYQIDFS